MVIIETDSFEDNTNISISDISKWCKVGHGQWFDDSHLMKLYYNGTPITDLIIPDGVEFINQGFNCCKTITSLTIPTSVKSISEYAFNYCSNLTSITYKGTTAQWEQMNVPPTSLPAGITITCTNGTLTTA